MKTKVLLSATISIEVDETWQNSTSLEQIQKDAFRAAERRLKALGPNSKEGIHIFGLRQKKVELFSEE